MDTPHFRATFALILTAAAVAAVLFLFPDQTYEWVKAVHIIAVIAWMAGMLYLPRLFIYHCASEPGSDKSETFKVMERRLLRIIINPAMLVTWVLGLWLVWRGDWLMAPWFWVKFACVIALSAAHGHFSAAVRRFAEDSNDKSERYWRLMNEVPTILMIVIVIMVVVKPI